jgi:cysteinyl-tRNA synthetase, unknown class
MSVDTTSATRIFRGGRRPSRTMVCIMTTVGYLCAMTTIALAGGNTSVSRLKSRELLAKVERWGCQYQNIDPNSIAASALDLVVVDPVIDGHSGQTAKPETVRMMQRKPDGDRRLVLAYLSIGAAEEYRPYWNRDWSAQPPPWLGAPNPQWPRSHSVRYWHPDWQAHVFDGLQKIIDAGFDGVFLDRVDAYGDWRDAEPTALQDMAAFVARIGQTARAQRSGFLLIGQNAEQLLPLTRYRNAIDAVSKESLLAGLQGEGVPNTPEDITWSMNFLLPAQRSGIRILTIEYLEGDDSIAAARAKHAAAGFTVFFGNRLLDRLPRVRLVAKSD